ncbi:iron chelate uptake ABC transporter family permease subunit [Sphingobacterium deserti]|uniref:Iron-siderophore ABC transporter permease n=1 Tax=Sphingobacterium deserti TaxID=1229276 RepID=A0A0B8T056_9SPHI|nr:iron chelate uptake ABC transporter family permease subunit [Sphingobacterium deserti]KGE13767.1 iron-siderophore ABC transporter permease [Sphingobacterium deserti]
MKALPKFIGLAIGLLLVAILFMQYDLGPNSAYALSKRGIRLGSMIVVGISVAFSSLIFQTLTNNRILTPSIMGYEAIFILFQTVLVFIYGDRAFQVISQETNFFYAVFFMLIFSIGMYLLMFGKQQKGMFHLLLLGMVMGTLFQTLSQFMHVLIDPNEFSIVQNFMFVSFAKMNTKLLFIASITLSGTILYAMYQVRYLDVIALGREHAINLGLDYKKLVRRFMLIIAVLVSVSTALVGPITFLGILVTNVTYELFRTREHRWMLWICSTIACLFLVIGQFLVEHVFSFSTTVSIIINFIGAVYFMYLIWMSRKKIA